MYKKILFVLCALLMVSTGAFAQMWIGGASGDWNNAANWDTGVPAAGSNPQSGMYLPDFTQAQLDAYATGDPYTYIPACPSYDLWTKQTIETYATDVIPTLGGIHLANQERMNAVVLNIRTNISVTGEFALADADYTSAEVNQYSGDVVIGDSLRCPVRYRGVYNLYGGTVSAPTVYVPRRNSGFAMPDYLGALVSVDGVACMDRAESAINLFGGTMTTTSLQISNTNLPNGLVNVAGGTLVLTGDQTAAVAAMVAQGDIVAYNGTASVVYSFDGTNTIVVPEPITMLMLGLGGIAALRRRK